MEKKDSEMPALVTAWPILTIRLSPPGTLPSLALLSYVSIFKMYFIIFDRPAMRIGSIHYRSSAEKSIPMSHHR